MEGGTEVNDDVICPECKSGKHHNCTGWAIDPDDEVTQCECVEGECAL